MKITSSIFILLSICCLTACKSSDKELKECNSNMSEKLIFQDPFKNWIRISCVQGGHAIIPTEKYTWSKNNKNAYLNASGDLSYITNNNEMESKGEFISVHVEKLNAYQEVNLNKDLSKELSKPVKFNNIYHIRVFSSIGFPYDLFLYLDNKKPQYILSCIQYCHVYEAEVIKISRINEKEKT